MLFITASLILIASLSPFGDCGTLKRKRASEPMVSDYVGFLSDDSGSGVDYEDYNPQDPAYYFFVTYEKKFNDKWLDPENKAFKKEAKAVTKTLTRAISRRYGILPGDIEVNVVSFLPGSTRAEVSISIPDHYAVTQSDLTRTIRDLANQASIGGAPITEVEDLNVEVEEDNMRNVLIAAFTYDFDISDEVEQLQDTFSEEFLLLSSTLIEQLSLLLLDQFRDVPVSSDEIDISVSRFFPEGNNTVVNMRLSVADVTHDDLASALYIILRQKGAEFGDKTLLSIDELGREKVPDYFTEDMFDAPLDDDYYGDGDAETDVIRTVMAGKDDESLNGHDNEEPVPTDDDIFAAIPSGAPGTDVPELAEPVPPEFCPEVPAPRRGSIVCLNGNEIESICQFTCDDDTRMVGTDTIVCGFDGSWNEDPPYCVRIFCQPPAPHDFLDGTVTCTAKNRFKSVCSFTCDEYFELDGAESVTCGRSEKWSEEFPECRLIPFDCEDEYGEWTGCANGVRTRAEVIVVRGSKRRVCPAQEEPCFDCVMKWGPWGACDDEDMRYRVETVTQEKVGAGKECTEPRLMDEACVACEVSWGDWSECSNNSRSRSQFISVQPVGDKTCPELQSEKQECLPCIVEWGEWGACVGGTVTRREEIIQQATNGGTACPELQEESEQCTNCAVEWGPWSECTGGQTTRSTVIVQSPAGRGDACPPQETGRDNCTNCVVNWSSWSECSDGIRKRQQVISEQPTGVGEACPKLSEEDEVCVHCELEWGDWEPCIIGLSKRTQYITVEKQGVGEDCEPPEEEYRACAECSVEWGNWGECEGGKRTRSQRITQQPINVDEPCPELQEQEEPCNDCEYKWTDWSECELGTIRRSLIVSKEPFGAGKPCPQETLEERACCFLDWGDWSECVDGERTRIEEIIIQPEGETCPEPQVEFEDCVDCVLAWGNWSKCEDNAILRVQFIQQQAMGGKDCSEPETEMDYCADCVVSWQPWGECSGGSRSRQQTVVEDAVGAGEPCPEMLKVDIEACQHCEHRWGSWSACEDGQRSRVREITKPAIGAGSPCPKTTKETEPCVNCVVEWDAWGQCENGERVRHQVIRTQPVGAGEKCPELSLEMEECVDCVMKWNDWSECANGSRNRTQYVLVEAAGVGRKCSTPATDFEECVDCVVEWAPWTDCFGGVRRRNEIITVEQVGAGRACPERRDLALEEEECAASPRALESLVCRFVHNVLGYARSPTMRDLLLIADESGSIGWINFEKIKVNFKSIARNIRGGIGSQETQLGMTSFASFSRMLFDFDDHHNVDDIVATIDKTFFKGGYRSKIGGALSDANVWLFQQAKGMRSFPNVEDNIEHEILIATDGCRTSDIYHLQEALKELKRRGIKLHVLGIATPDIRCRRTVESMVDDKNDLYMVGSWTELDEMSQRIDEGVCRTVKSSETSGDDASDSSDDVSSASGPTESRDDSTGGSRGDSVGGSRGDSAGGSRGDSASNYKLGDVDE